MTKDLLYDPITLRAAFGPIDINQLPNVERTREGEPKALQPITLENVAAGLRLLGVTPRINMMNAKTSFVLPERIDYERFGTLSDDSISRMVIEALADCFHRARLKSRDMVKKLITEAAQAHRWHPMLDFATAQPWDGIDRYQQLLETVQTPTPDLLAVYLRRWLLQTVECFAGWQVRQQSQKALALVFVGDQGIRKSRWLTRLVPEGMARGGIHLNLSGMNSRDSKHEALKQLITELGEIGTTTRKSYVEDLKAFLAAESDSYRLPFGAEWTDRPRCTSFCGTTNSPEFLVDSSGNRRFLPVEVTRCNPDHGIDLMQLWAQVYSWWKAGEQWWLTEEEEDLQRKRNVEHTQTDGVADTIEREIERRKDPTDFPILCGLNVTDILNVIGLDALHPLIRGKGTDAITKLLGKSRTLTKWGGAKRAWEWWATRQECREFKLRTLSQAVCRDSQGVCHTPYEVRVNHQHPPTPLPAGGNISPISRKPQVDKGNAKAARPPREE